MTSRRKRGMSKYFVRSNSKMLAGVVEVLEPRKLLSAISFSAVTSYPLIGDASGNAVVVLADFNHDSRPDVAAIQGNALSVAFGNSDGTFTTPTSSLDSNNAEGYFVTTADVNGDTGPDIPISRCTNRT